jgi:hypothetical protein
MGSGEEEAKRRNGELGSAAIHLAIAAARALISGTSWPMAAIEPV